MKCLHLLEVLVFDTLTFTLSPKLMYLDLLKTSSKCVITVSHVQKYTVITGYRSG